MSAAVLKRPAPPASSSASAVSHRRPKFFGRRLSSNLEEVVSDFLTRHAGSNFRVVIGRILGNDSSNDVSNEVVLPISLSQGCVLEGTGHTFNSSLPTDNFKGLQKVLDEHRASWQDDVTNGGKQKRWTEFSLQTVFAPKPRHPAEALTVYVPECGWHYQLQAGDSKSETEAHPKREERKETRYLLQKQALTDSIWWRVSLCEDCAQGDTSPNMIAELDVSPRWLWSSLQRAKSGQDHHQFHLIVASLLHNARELSIAVHRSILSDVKDIGSKQRSSCFYPGFFDDQASIREFYEQKAAQGLSNVSSMSHQIRAHNNLIKVMLIENSIDVLPFDMVKVLDLGCGQGQDIQKYSRQFRKKQVGHYIGVDFASSAIEEARRRHASLKRRARGSDYDATFYVGSASDDRLFNQLAREGHTSFHAVSIQFALQYLAESEHAVKKMFTRLRDLLPPGGRVLGSVPTCEVLAEMAFTKDAGNQLFRINFPTDVNEFGSDIDEVTYAFDNTWGIPYTFTLVDAVEELREFVVPWGAFETMLNSLGFRVFLDGMFPEIKEAYKTRSSFYEGVFSKDGRNRELNTAELNIFGLYYGFVLIRTDPEEEVKRLRRGDAKQRREALEALGGLRTAASAYLADVSRVSQEDDDPTVREIAKQTLQQISQDSQ